jgi:hypothetical protein
MQFNHLASFAVMLCILGNYPWMIIVFCPELANKLVVNAVYIEKRLTSTIPSFLIGSSQEPGALASCGLAIFMNALNFLIFLSCVNFLESGQQGVAGVTLFASIVLAFIPSYKIVSEYLEKQAE